MLNVSSPPAAKAMGGVTGWQPGDYGGQTKNLEAMGEINGWIGIERLIPSAKKSDDDARLLLNCLWSINHS